MSKKIKYIVSISLVLILLTPMTIKLLDSTLHYHNHFVCTAKNVKHLHKYHKICPIQGFELSLYTLNKVIHESQKTYYHNKLFINYISPYYNSNSKYSFSLRAPPLKYKQLSFS